MSPLRPLIAVLILSCFSLPALADAPRAYLWPAGAPGAVGDTPDDKPFMAVHLPPADKAVGTAVIACPGGAYSHLSTFYEGTPVAHWLNQHGIAVFALNYRLGPRYHYPAQQQDVLRAIRYVRAHAGEYHISPNRIGLLGFSAGGHLATLAETHFDAGRKDAKDPIDQQSSRPDFVMLAYPVITMLPPYTHEGSVEALLGKDASKSKRRAVSSELHVTSKLPPTFLFHGDRDNLVPPENSVMYYLALRKAKVPAEMIIDGKAWHGVALSPDDAGIAMWTKYAEIWMKNLGLMDKASDIPAN